MDHREVVEYEVVAADDLEDVKDEVRHLIGRGYQPLGPMNVNTVQTRSGGYHYTFFQTMVQYAEADSSSDLGPEQPA